jgi:DNA polymerase-3 subunit delta
MPASPTFTFIAGQDDYLVDRLGQKRFQAATGDFPDGLTGEVISGFAANVGEVEAAINRFREAVQTIPMFGGKRTVWLKDVNFLAETQTGKAETTLALLEDLKALLQSVNPEETSILITAAPVDRRRSFPKWCEQNADFTLADDGDSAGEALPGLVMAEAKAQGAAFGPGAVERLLAQVGPNARLLVEETRKLANFASQPAEASARGGPAALVTIREDDVAQLTPNVAEGDFFETAEAFFSGDLHWTLDALRRHFFAGGDARPIIAALQSRNRLLLQVRTLLNTGVVRIGARGLEGLPSAAQMFRDRYGDAATVKSGYNVFAQNAWYLSKLAGGAKLPSLPRLIDNQRELIAAFDEIVRRPDEQEDVLRDMAVRCLAG